MARILHGVASPAFPAAQWSKSGFWQRYTDVDFAHVTATAQHELNSKRHCKEAAGSLTD